MISRRESLQLAGAVAAASLGGANFARALRPHHDD